MALFRGGLPYQYSAAQTPTKRRALPELRPDHKMLWSAPPDRLGGGLFFHQVIETEGVVFRRKVYIMGLSEVRGELLRF